MTQQTAQWACVDDDQEGHCPTCRSPQPHLHPAVQFEGEVQLCLDDFHLTPTPQNSPAYIAGVVAEREARASREGKAP